MFRNWNQIDYGVTTLPWPVNKRQLESFGRAGAADDDGWRAQTSKIRPAASVWKPLGGTPRPHVRFGRG